MHHEKHLRGSGDSKRLLGGSDSLPRGGCSPHRGGNFLLKDASLRRECELCLRPVGYSGLVAGDQDAGDMRWGMHAAEEWL
jgi:hypothetical protein